MGLVLDVESKLDRVTTAVTWFIGIRRVCVEFPEPTRQA